MNVLYLFLWLYPVFQYTPGKADLWSYQTVNTELGYKTVSIINDAYLVTRNWGKIPVNRKTGEDVNSQKFGGIYYPPASKGFGVRENRTSIARESMEIEIDLINHTADTWMLESITLNILNIYTTEKVDHEIGEWEIGARTMAYNPTFEIEENGNSITDIPDEVFIDPKDEMTDSRMILEVMVGDHHSGSRKIYTFNFLLLFSKTGGEKKRIQVTSDKTYFIASA